MTNLKFQHKSKYYLSKNPHIKLDLLLLLLLLLLPRGQSPLSCYILYNESKTHNILALVGNTNKNSSVVASIYWSFNFVEIYIKQFVKWVQAHLSSGSVSLELLTVSLHKELLL
jgi:hypothetical protein